MRNLIYLLILFPVIVFAQEQPGIPPNMPMNMEEMQRNMQQMDMGKMQEAMACMKKRAFAEEKTSQHCGRPTFKPSWTVHSVRTLRCTGERTGECKLVCAHYSHNTEGTAHFASSFRLP